MKRLEYKNPLALEDFANNSPEEVRNKIAEDFKVQRTELDKFQILIAYMSEGSWGCDSSAWFLLRDRETGALFENHAGHCSCYGYDDQWTPEPTTLEYLKSDKFSFSCGGYDDHAVDNKAEAKKFILENL
jgi:hypothetical protein